MKALTGGGGVGGSNPLVPTIFKGLTDLSVGSFLLWVTNGWYLGC
jgi:hypothetical protein